MSLFLLEIVTPERIVYSQQVKMVIAKGVEGELGILANHIPLVTPLRIAPVTIKTEDGEEIIAVNGGFMEVRKDKVVILAESSELPSEIDIERAIAAREKAEQRLLSNLEAEELRNTEIELQRALNRIKVSERK